MSIFDQIYGTIRGFTQGVSSASLRSPQGMQAAAQIDSHSQAAQPGAWASSAPVRTVNPQTQNRLFVDGWRNTS